MEFWAELIDNYLKLPLLLEPSSVALVKFLFEMPLGEVDSETKELYES